MSATKFLRGECQHCGGHLEFPAEAAGSSAECPHCQQQTELFLSAGDERETRKTPVKTIVFIAIATVILLGGLGGAMIALKRAKHMAAKVPEAQPAQTNAAPANPFAAQKFSAAAVVLEKDPGSSLVRAVGSIKNLSNQRRFGVRVEIEIQDENGLLLDPAKDYTATLDPGATWNFKALVKAKGAASGKISGIKEDN